MAARTATLSIRVLVDAAQGASELNQLGDSATGAGDKFKKLAVAGAAFAGVTAFIKSAVDAASNLQQSTGGVEAVFKDSAGAVQDWARESAQALGISQNSYQELATLIGAQLKNAGTSMDDLAPSTKKLIEQGADLSAMFGGTATEAVSAISAALKGERDPIERYGISLTEAAVQAKILEMGLDTSTTAAEQNAKAMATLALIQEQGTDAWGAAAREADSYASVQQRVGAVWEDTMAQVGSALLPVLSELGNGFAQIAPAVGAVLGVLASLLAMVLDLPGPILAAAGAFAAWTILGGLTGIIEGLTAAMVFLKGAVTRLWVSLGPIGLLALGVATAMAFLMDSSDDAAEAQEANAQASEDLKGTLDATTGAITEQTRATAAQQAQSAGVLATLERLGVATTAYTDAAVGAAGGAERLGVQVAAASDRVLQASGAYQEVSSALNEAGVSATDFVAAVDSGDISGMRAQVQEYADSVSQASGNLSDGQTIMAQFDAAVAGTTPDIQALSNAQLMAQQSADGLGGAQSDVAQVARATGDAAAGAAGGVAQLSEAQEKAAVAAAKQAAENSAVSTALGSVKAAADAASTAVQFFVVQMDLAAGRNVTMDAAAAALNASLRGTAEAFTSASEAGKLDAQALAEWNVGALTASDEGAAVYDSLLKMQTGYATSTTAAYSNAAANGDAAAGFAAAQAAADTAYASFISTATAAGLTGDQAAALAAKLGIVQGVQLDPKTFQLIAEDQAADQAVADLQAAQIPDKNVNVNATVAPATGAIDAVAGASYDATVTTDANTAPAAGDIQDVAGGKYQATVTTNADTNPAQSTVQGFTSAQRSTQVQVQANTTAAQDAITALVNQRRTLTITVDANTAPAQQAINNIQGRTVTVTVQQNTIQSVTPAPAPALAMAAPMSLMAGAPTAAGYGPLRLHTGASATSADNAPQPIVINVSGALDPDAVGRQIEGILLRQERRRRGTAI